MPTKHAGTHEETLALDVFIKLNRACQSVNRAVHAPLREAGLTEIQFGVLDALVHLGAMPVSGLAEKNLCSQNSLSSVIDTMERNGLVRRVRSDKDRRVVSVELTAGGRTKFELVWPEHRNRIIERVSVLSVNERMELDRLLRKLGVPPRSDGS